jgi:hypothetical protein
VDLAEVVVEAELFPKCLTCLKYPDDAVRKAAATLCREVGLGPRLDLLGSLIGPSAVARRPWFVRTA